MGLSRRAYAAYRKERGLPGGTDAAVRKALATGRITLGPDGTIDPVKADWQWEFGTDANKQRGPESQAQAVETSRETIARGEVKPVPTEAIEAVREADADSGGSGLTFAKARTADMALKVKRGQLLLAKMRNELVDRKAAELHVFNLARMERDHWLQAPARYAAVIAAELDCDAHDVEMALENMVRDHLLLLAEIKVDLTPQV